jgi:hypothetical protein
VEGGIAERKAMIDPEHDLPIKQQAHQDADEADGNRGHLSQTQHFQTRARAEALPVLTARSGRHPAQRSLGDGNRLQYAQPAYLGRMEASFCIEAVEDALSRNEKPEVFNSDQGSQFIVFV